MGCFGSATCSFFKRYAPGLYHRGVGLNRTGGLHLGGALEAFGLSLGVVRRKAQHGVPLLDWLAGTELIEGKGVVWLSGEAVSVRALKEVFVRRGLDRTQLKIKPYWSVKGHAHRKALQSQL